MGLRSLDVASMEMALREAEKGCGHTRPNPPVGAVVLKDGRVIGKGHHRRCGGDHAEVAALKNCRESPRGATVFVTLEPCSRPGRVGACTAALIAAGVKRVEWAIPDPNPTNRGRAARVLHRAGIETACWSAKPQRATQAVVERANRLIAPFAKHVRTGLPFVTVKIALSLDGKICDDQGRSRWISSSASRAWTGDWRSRVDCMLVGAETVRRDNPSLLCHARRNDDLFRAVVTRRGDLPKSSQIFTDAAKERTLVYRVGEGTVKSLTDVLCDLGRRGFMHVFCEGGLNLARSLADEGLVDEWLTVLCPLVIGSRPISEALRFDRVESVSSEGVDFIGRSLCLRD